MSLKFSNISWLGLTLGLVLNYQAHAICAIDCTKNKCNQSEQVTNSCVDKCKSCQDIKKGRDDLKNAMKIFDEKKNSKLKSLNTSLDVSIMIESQFEQNNNNNIDYKKNEYNLFLKKIRKFTKFTNSKKRKKNEILKECKSSNDIFLNPKIKLKSNLSEIKFDFLSKNNENIKNKLVVG